MSYYRFFASNKEMPEFDNRKAKPITVDGKVIAISFASEVDEEKAMRIRKEEDDYYAKKFTNKEHINYLEWCYNDENAHLIVDYIKDLLVDRFTVSLFNTWLGDESALVIKKIDVDDLCIEDIRELWGQKSFEKNECLVIFGKVARK